MTRLFILKILMLLDVCKDAVRRKAWTITGARDYLPCMPLIVRFRPPWQT